MVFLPVVVGAALACSVAKQDCPEGQFCAAPWDEKEKKCPEEGQCAALPAAPPLELALPVPSGERVYCGKGNLRQGTSHNPCSAPTRFAYDLVSPAFEPPHLVVASADGVAYGWGGCATSDLNWQTGPERCNEGWGNVVRVQHGGYYTQYGHLSAVLVHWGQTVKRGQPIGIEGNTGAAGAKHIHWSLHAGEALKRGPSVPMGRVRWSGKVTGGREIPCGDWNAGDAPEPATALTSDNRLVAQPERFRFRATVGELSAMLFSGDHLARERAIAELRARPEDGEARYYLGAGLQEAGKLSEARGELEVARSKPGGPWVRWWVKLRLGEIAVAEGRKEEGRRAIEEALAEAAGDVICADRARRDLEKLK
jgi:hypothetical protein